MTDSATHLESPSFSSTWHTMRPYLPGLLIVFLVGMASWQLGRVMPRPGSVTLAILLGILVGNLLPNIAPYASGIRVVEKRLLPLSIALLGVELQLVMLLDLGLLAALVIVLGVATSLLASLYLGRLLGYPLKFSLLIGAGTGICGSSAIAATSGAIDADGDDIGISISVVNLLGTAGIFTLPAIVTLLNLSEVDGGMLIGGTLQAVGQVVAAGFSMNDTVGSVATVVKMGRVLMLAPVVIALASMMRSGNMENGKKLNPVRVPLFIIGFFIFSILASLSFMPDPAIGGIKTTGKF
ncbi:MAG: putative sulfate exporter family transporter, partial [Chloroflexota bacterium]